MMVVDKIVFEFDEMDLESEDIDKMIKKIEEIKGVGPKVLDVEIIKNQDNFLDKI